MAGAIGKPHLSALSIASILFAWCANYFVCKLFSKGEQGEVGEEGREKGLERKTLRLPSFPAGRTAAARLGPPLVNPGTLTVAASPSESGGHRRIHELELI